MPLFMLVSGYLFAFSCKKRNLSALLVHRTQGLLQPIIMCTIFNYIVTEVLLKRHLIGILGAGWLSSLGSLWFLWSVLASSIIIAIAFKSSKKIFVRIVIAIAGFAFVSMFPNFDMNIYMYPYFLLGFVFAFVKDRLPGFVMNIRWTSLIVFPFLLCFFEKKHYIYTTGIINKQYTILSLIEINIYRWIIGLVGSIFVLVLVELFVRFVYKYNFFIFIGNAISALGRKSLQVYCISVSLLSSLLSTVYPLICNKIGFNILSWNMTLYNCVFTPIIAIAYAVGLYYLVCLLEKIKVGKLLFGR